MVSQVEATAAFPYLGDLQVEHADLLQVLAMTRRCKGDCTCVVKCADAPASHPKELRLVELTIRNLTEITPERYNLLMCGWAPPELLERR